MADNTSSVQHITALDFDITQAIAQLSNIQQKIENLTQFVNSQNWKLSDMFNLDGTANQTNSVLSSYQQIESLMQRQSALAQQIQQSNAQNVATSQQGLSVEQQIEAARTLAANTYNSMAQQGQTINQAELTRLDSIRRQTEYIQAQYAANGQLTSSQQARLSALTTELQQYRRITNQVGNINATTQQRRQIENEILTVTNKVSAAQKTLNSLSGQEAEQHRQNLTALQNQVNVLVQEYNTTGNLTAQQRTQLDTLNKQLTTEQAIVKNLQNEANLRQQSATATSNQNSMLLSRLNSAVISTSKQALSEAASTVKSTEDHMMLMQRILASTDSETAKMKQNLFDIAQEFGNSFEDAADIALRFTQAGYSMNDVLTGTQNALLAVNTAELDAENATVSLIAILKQWDYGMSDLMTVIDKLNYTADNNAITTQDLVDALQKASSVAKTANMSFDDTVGVLTAMKVSSGAAGKEVGNAFKSILSYIQRDKSLAAFEGLGIDIWADKTTGTLNDMMYILQQMADMWNSGSAEMQANFMAVADDIGFMNEELAVNLGMDEEYQQYTEAMAQATDKANDAESRLLANQAAGTYRRNYYVSLMKNFSDATAISADLMNAEGHSMEQNSLYMETLTAKTTQLVTALKELAVTAADAGALDLAKNLVEAATAVVKFTNNQKALIPILLSIVGIITTLKAQKIAGEITAIGSSFANVINNLKGIETAASSASAGVATLSTTLGWIGLAVTAVGLVTSGIKAYEQAQEQARQETIDAAKTEKEQADSLERLIERFDTLKKRQEELKKQTSLTADEQEELSTVTENLSDLQKTLSETYHDQAGAIDLVNGKYDEQISKLDELTQKELEALSASQRSALTAAQKSNAEDTIYVEGIGKTDTGKGTVDYLTTAAEAFEKANADYGIALAGISTDLKGNIEIWANIGEENLDALYAALKAVEDAGGKYSAEWDAIRQTISDVEERLSDVTTAADDLANTNLNLYIREQGNAIEALTVDGFAKWKQGLVEMAQGNKYAEQSLSELADQYYETAKQNSFSNIFKDSEGQFDGIYTKLLDTAKAGKLTVAEFNNIKESNKAFKQAFETSNVTMSDAVKYLNGFATMEQTTTDTTDDLNEALAELSDDEIKALETQLSNSEAAINTLNKSMQSLRDGNSLTADEVKNLIDTYGMLPSQFEKTEDGYTTEISNLEAVRDAQIELATTARLQLAGYTDAVIESMTNTAQAYLSEAENLGIVDEATRTRIETLETYADVVATVAALEELLAKKQELRANIDPHAVDHLTAVDNEITALMEHLESLGGYEAEIGVTELYDETGMTTTSSGTGTKSTSTNADYKSGVDAEQAKKDFNDLEYWHNKGLVEDADYYDKKYELANKYYKSESESWRSIDVERSNYYKKLADDEAKSDYKAGIDVDAAEKAFSDLEYLFDMGEIDADEYYKKLGEYAEQFYKNDSDKWRDVQKKIHDYTESKETPFESLMSGFDKLVEKGAYSVDEQIEYLENLRDNFELTEEEAETLQKKLDELYSTQVSAGIDGIKKAYEEAIDLIEDTYDDLTDRENERYEKTKENLEKEKEARLNAIEEAYNSQMDAIENSNSAALSNIETQKTAQINAIKASYDAQIKALEDIKAARNRSRNAEDYEEKRAELLEELSYWEQRTGTNAVEKVEEIKKQIADLDKDRAREVEDENLDAQIQALEDARDSETENIQNQYDFEKSLIERNNEIQKQQIKDNYEQQKKAAEELYKNQLETLEEQHKKRLEYLTEEKDDAISVKQLELDRILELMDEYNTKLLESAATVAPQLYEEFQDWFANPFSIDILNIEEMVSRLSTDVKDVLLDISKLDTSELTPKSKSKSKSKIPALATGGYIRSEGLAYLHPAETVINSNITQKLEEFLKKFDSASKLNVDIEPKYTSGIAEMMRAVPEIIARTNVVNNNTYGGDNKTNHIEFNAPLQTIENVNGQIDLEEAEEHMEKNLMRKIQRKM